MIERLGTDPDRSRSLYLARIGRLDEWPERLDKPAPHFVALLALNAREVSDAEIGRFADSLLSQGAAYVCAWGPDCERVHDLFDEAVARRAPELAEALVMTTWHEEEPLDGALWFAMFSACPEDAYIETCGALLAIAVGNEDWAEILRRRFGNPEGLRAAFL